MTDQAMKHDTGKPGIAWLPMAELQDIAEVLDFGAIKYDRGNWKKGMPWMKIVNSMLRHIFAWTLGEKIDPESGKSHLAHAACNILFLMYYEKHRQSFDDRDKPEGFSDGSL